MTWYTFLKNNTWSTVLNFIIWEIGWNVQMKYSGFPFYRFSFSLWSFSPINLATMPLSISNILTKIVGLISFSRRRVWLDHLTFFRQGIGGGLRSLNASCSNIYIYICMYAVSCSQFISICISLVLILWNSVNVANQFLQGHDFITSDHQAAKSWPTNLLLTHIFLFNVAADSSVRPQSR